MKTLIKYFAIALIFTAGGYWWAFSAYQPLQLAQEIRELKADVQNCERRWSRDFSKKHGLIEEGE